MMKDKPTITVFHCINAFRETTTLTTDRENDGFYLKIVKMSCSGMTKDIFLLKAFEAGADAVVVLVCPEEACRYAQGNLRAAKRVKWTQEILEEIGLDGRRLSIHNVRIDDEDSVKAIIKKTLETIELLGPNPAA